MPATAIVAVALGLIVSACGTSGPASSAGGAAPTGPTGTSAGTSPTTQPSPLLAPTTTAPAKARVVPGRLAIGTGAGMEVWSSATGVFAVGPTVHGVVVSDIAWSGDGRFLSWQTRPAVGRRGTELWYADVRSGAVHHWGPRRVGSYGPVVVTDAGVLTFGPKVVRYAPGAAPSTVGRSATASPGPGSVQAWGSGWVVEPDAGGAVTVERLDTAGAALAPVADLGAVTGAGLAVRHEAVDLAGRTFAAELGDRAAGCGRGSSQLLTASLYTGVVGHSTPPQPVQGAAQRFWSVDVSGPTGVVYASTYDCTAGSYRDGSVLATTLWRYQRGDWHRIGAHLLAADQSSAGVLATLAGDVGIAGRPASAVAGGRGAVVVDGQVVAIGGESLRWAPATTR